MIALKQVSVRQVSYAIVARSNSTQREPERCKLLRRIPYFTILYTIVQIITYNVGNYAAMCFDRDDRAWWRLLTYSLVHASPEHFAVNLVPQVVMSTAMEIDLGFFMTVLVVTVGTVSGALGTFIMESMMSMVGSSAICYALLGALFANIILNLDSMKYKRTKICFAVSVLLGEVVFWATGNFISSYDRISWASHIAGFLSGFFLCFRILPYSSTFRGLKTIRSITQTVFPAVFCSALSLYLFSKYF